MFMSPEQKIYEAPLTFRKALFLPATMSRGLKVGLIIGTLLIFINHAEVILNGNWPAPWEIFLTYLVPFSVSSHATAASLAGLAKN